MLRRRWLRWTILAVALLFAGSELFSRLLQTNAARRYLTARLQASFGRPVDVAGFDFSLLDGPRIEVLGISVAEDPRFGSEYFLRAEKLTAGPRWSALFAGKFEFGTLSFTRPSLNVVRAANGGWNLEGWLPQTASSASGRASSSGLPFHLTRIEVDSGRVNFRQGNSVRPFALFDVTGYIQQARPGRWDLAFEAEPMHVGVGQPQTGRLRLSGSIGGTTTRLQPAQLELAWWGVSFQDALRLIRGQDYGVRGSLSADLTANVAGISAAGANAVGPPAPALWNVSGSLWFSGAHRWDLPSRSSDPPLDLSFSASWKEGERRIALPSVRVLAPSSNMSASAVLDWTRGMHPHIEVSSSEIEMADVLAWYRAFRAGVADDLIARGFVRASATLDGWPPHLVRASFSSDGGNLSAGPQSRMLMWGPWSTKSTRGTTSFGPISVQFASPKGNPSGYQAAPLNVQFDLLPQSGIITTFDAAEVKRGRARGPSPIWPFMATLEGSAGRVEDWLWFLREVGHATAPDWSADGIVALHLKAQGTLRPIVANWQGSADIRAFNLQMAYLNQPLHFLKASYNLNSGSRKLTLTSVEGLGANWDGTISKNSQADDWHFDLVADHLDAATLDRWLGPQGRPDFLNRLYGGVSAVGGEAGVAVPLVASGHLRVGQFTFGSLQMNRIEADASISGRKIVLEHAKANFFGGSAEGNFTATLAQSPVYEVHAQFQHVNLAPLTGQLPTLADRISGVAAGRIALHANGLGREALLSSLEGEGSLSVRNAELRGFGLGSISPDVGIEDDAHFPEVDARFHLSSRKIAATPLRLRGSGGSFLATGSVDFNGVMDFRVASLRGTAASREVIFQAPGGYRLTGTLTEPQISPFDVSTTVATDPPSRGQSKSVRP